MSAYRCLHAGRRYHHDSEHAGGLPAGTHRRDGAHPGGVDRPGLLHRLDRHSVAHGADLCAGGDQVGVDVL